MSNLLIIGAGGHGRVVADAAIRMGSWEKMAFLDDRFPGLTETTSASVIGRINAASEQKAIFDTAIVGIGNAKQRLEIIKQLSSLGFKIATIIHPSAVVANDAVIGSGSVLFAGAVVNTGSRIGVGCIINTAASVDHDCMLEDGVHVCPGGRLAGDVTVGSGTWIGIGSSINQQISIGKHALIGAGAAVITDVPDNWTVIGVPAKRIQDSG